MEQKTYIMIKPDAVARGLVGRSSAASRKSASRSSAWSSAWSPREQAAANYAEHEGKPFYDGLVAYITSGPVVKMVLSGPEAVSVVPQAHGRHEPRRRRAGHHPRRLRSRSGRQRDPRVRLAGVGRA